MSNASITSGIHCGESADLIRLVPSESVHLILSDIPYGIGADEWDVLHENANSALLGQSPAQKRAGAIFKRRGKPINGWSDADASIPKEYYDWCSKWSAEWLRVLKPGGSAIVFAGRRFAHRCIVALEDSGFNFRDMLAWVRPRAVHRAQRLSIVFERRRDAPRAKHWAGWRLGNLRPTFEPIIWCFKPYAVTITDNVAEHGVGAWNQEAFERYFHGADNVLACGMDAGEGGKHPNQKPARLMRALVDLTTMPGHTVLDPFAGSGTTLLAAKMLGRESIGFERSREHVETTRARLREYDERTKSK